MQATFTLYDDFLNYTNGTYEHVNSGNSLGVLQVRVIGWGDGYWICANDWGETWGENGFFSIKFGDSGIEDNVYACTPALL